MKFWLRTCASIAVCIALFNTTRSQSKLEVTIQQFPAEQVAGYIQPLGDMLGANMNAGLYHSAAIDEDDFHLRIDVIAMASLVRESDRVYNTHLPAGFVPQGGSLRTATIFGGEGTTFSDIGTGMRYKGTDGLLSTNYLPLFVPQLTIGSIGGTEASVRYLATPSLASNKLPPTTLFGVGLRHSISQYIPDSPLDICVGAFYSTFKVGDILDFQGTAANLQLSKTFFIATVYGGAAWESSNMQLHYNYKTNSDETPMLVDVALNGGNTFRFTTGLMLDLQAIRLYADANFGTVQHFSGGIGFGF
jgi:hypothetical protein